jgi:hypothetical protein
MRAAAIENRVHLLLARNSTPRIGAGHFEECTTGERGDHIYNAISWTQ